MNIFMFLTLWIYIHPGKRESKSGLVKRGASKAYFMYGRSASS